MFLYYYMLQMFKKTDDFPNQIVVSTFDWHADIHWNISLDVNWFGNAEKHERSFNCKNQKKLFILEPFLVMDMQRGYIKTTKHQ